MSLYTRRICASLAVAMISISCVASSPFAARVGAQELNSLASAKLAPIDADFYSVSLRMQEQWQRFVSGPVVKEFLQLSVVEKTWDQFRNEWAEKEGAGNTIRDFLENGNTKDALNFLKDLVDSEVFAFGDKNMSVWYDAQAKLSDEMRATWHSSTVPPEQRAIELVVKSFETASNLTVPTLVVGAKCKNVDLALGKIDQLEAVLQLARSTVPNGDLIMKNLDRVDDARGDRLQWRFDGKQVPWDLIPTSEFFDEETKDRVQEAVEKKSITLTIGMFDGFFVVALSPSSKALLELGKGKSILEHPEMQPVRDASAKQLTSIGFTSDALMKATFNANLNNFFSRNSTSNLVALMPAIEDEEEVVEYVKSLVEDCFWMDESIAKLVPEFKGATTLSYLTEEGWERHDYLRTKDVLADGNAPLVVLEHLGDQPMMFLATRLQNRPEYFQLSRKIVQKLKARFDEAFDIDWSGLEDRFGQLFPGQDGNNIFEDESVLETTDLYWPFLVRLADTWEKRFLPAMTGEHAIVLGGGNLAAKQWFEEMPASSDALPLAELAVVCGIKDEALMKGAFDDFLKICDDIVETVRNNDSNAIPAGYKIPRPVKSDAGGREKFSYAIPSELPLPKGLMPQALFAGGYLIESYSDNQTQGLAGVRKLTTNKGPIDPSAKQSTASYINLGRIFDFARPWVRYALSEGMESMQDSLLEGSLPPNYELTGKDLLSVWSVLTKIGELSSATVPQANGGSHVRSVYRVQKQD